MRRSAVPLLSVTLGDQRRGNKLEGAATVKHLQAPTKAPPPLRDHLPPPFKRQSDRFPLLRMRRHQGKQLYLGGYTVEGHAARAHDIIAIKCRGIDNTYLNFAKEHYEQLVVRDRPMAAPRGQHVPST